MDARESLRRYLEQRRDLGESELVLDSLSVEDALRLLGATAGGSSSSERGGSGRSRHASTPTATLADKVARPATPTVPTTQAAAVAPGAPAVPATKDTPRTPDAPSAPATLSSAGLVGLSVGGGSRSVGDDPIAPLQSLEEIAAAVAGCRRCPLYATAINPVPGAGNPDADFMIVGEAPGANEDAQGVPFVGQAGQLLTKIIEAINLRRDDVFIANVLKHRPPGNRNPLPEEVAACSPYLVRQIELVRPKVLLALGTFAAQTLLETKLTIGKLRGQEHRYYGVPLVVTYHPAALLRNPAWKRPTWEDVQLARRILDRALAAGA